MTVRLGTRGSALALVQARAAAAAIGGDVEIVVVSVRGDRQRDAPDKEKWVAELERALLDGEVDVAVHSAKDVPTSLPQGLALAGTLPRQVPTDALLGAPSLAALAPGARVGTASLRRAAQLRALRDDLQIVEVRGNVDTRLGKLAAGEIDALVLAEAGLARLERSETRVALDTVPAAGQGIVVLETRAGEDLALPCDDDAWRALHAERACVHALGADCDSAVGAHATVQPDGALLLRAWAGAADGSQWIADEQRSAQDPSALGEAVAARMLAAGAAKLIA